MGDGFFLHTTAALAAAVALDIALGDSRRYHPLAGFGWCADVAERLCNHGSAATRTVLGGIALLIVIAAPVAAAIALHNAPLHFGVVFTVDVVVLYFALGMQSLHRHAHATAAALSNGELAQARTAVAHLVSRDTSALDDTGVAVAASESVLENGNDAVFGVVFWYLLLGLPGAVAYRLVNTLDAMWGYRNKRFNFFGRCAARADDVLNFFPARVTAFFYCIVGNFFSGITCWRKQSKKWKSKNAGATMSAGAGTLKIKLGGAAVYAEKTQHRPTLGCGNSPTATDIPRAVNLVWRALGLWLALAAAVELAWCANIWDMEFMR